jgi:hypothetical protein
MQCVGRMSDDEDAFDVEPQLLADDVSEDEFEIDSEPESSDDESEASEVAHDLDWEDKYKNSVEYDVYIKGDDRIGSDILQTAECSAILQARAAQIDKDGNHMIHEEVGKMVQEGRSLTCIDIAKLELKLKKTPIWLNRPRGSSGLVEKPPGSGRYVNYKYWERWNPNEMPCPDLEQ